VRAQSHTSSKPLDVCCNFLKYYSSALAKTKPPKCFSRITQAGGSARWYHQKKRKKREKEREKKEEI
jgi:hypothetical protein